MLSQGIVNRCGPRRPGATRIPRSGLVQLRLWQVFHSRKNSLFYKTLHGAEVGDLYMSLIHTCELNNANPFDYLTELQRHSAEVAARPAEWMPWNYRAALARMQPAAA